MSRNQKDHALSQLALSSSNESKGFAPIIIILIIAAVLGGSVYFVKTHSSVLRNNAPVNQEVTPPNAPQTTSTVTPTHPQSKKTNPTPTPTNTPSNSSNNSNFTPTPTRAQVSGNVIQVNTPTPSSPGLSTTGAKLNVSSVNITMNRGETKNNVFSITSIGATSYTLYGYPISYGSGINWYPDGGMIPGSTYPINFEVLSTVPVGTYTGTGIIKVYPSGCCSNATQINLPITINVVNASESDLRFILSTRTINTTIKRGQSSGTVMTFTSTGSTGFSFTGSLTTYGPGINWRGSGGGAAPGVVNNQIIDVNSNVAPGTYHGTPGFRDTSTGAEVPLDVTVTVTD